MKDKLNNSGNNNGVMVGDNSGNIQINNYLNNPPSKLPSLIGKVIQVLGEKCFEENNDPTLDLTKFKIDDKITHNSLIKYKEIIKEFSLYYTICDNYLNTYDNSNIRRKSKILQWVRWRYLNIKGNFLSQNNNSGKSELDLVREHSDQIIDSIKNQICEIVMDSIGFENIYIEELDLGVICFICYCFMECKILEKPS